MEHKKSAELLKGLEMIKSQIETAETANTKELHESAIQKIKQFLRLIQKNEFGHFLRKKVTEDGIGEFLQYKDWLASCLWKSFVSGEPAQLWASFEYNQSLIIAIGEKIRFIAELLGLRGKYVYAPGGTPEVQVTFQIKK